MRRLLFLATTVALVAGCSRGPDQIQPGQWESTVQYSSIDMPGAPPEMLEQMRATMSQPQTNSACITPEQAADPAGHIINPGGEANCDYSDSTFSGGTVRLRGTCSAPGQGTMQISMEGSYTATTLETEISTEASMPGGPNGDAETMRMAGTLSSRRTGDCTAADESGSQGAAKAG